MALMSEAEGAFNGIMIYFGLILAFLTVHLLLNTVAVTFLYPFHINKGRPKIRKSAGKSPP